MWSTNKRDCCLRSVLLIINCTGCIAIVYIYLKYGGEQGNVNARISEDFFHSDKLTSENCTPICVSRACIWHANLLLRNMNSTADPCDNFHSFLCGGFQREFSAEEGANLMSQTKSMITRLKSILDNLQPEPGSASEKMKTVYNSCVNYGSSELRGITDFRNLLGKLRIANWPFLEQDFHFENVTLPVIFINFMIYAAKPFMFFKNMPENADIIRVAFNPYLFNKSTSVPRDFAVALLKYFDLESENMETIIQDHELVKDSIINLYKRVNRCSEEEECFSDTISCGRQTEDDWQEFCETLGVALNFTLTNDTNAKVIVFGDQKMFYKDLLPLLHSHPNKSLANFFALSLFMGYHKELSFHYRLNKLKHMDEEEPEDINNNELDRWKFCVRWISSNMKFALENEFYHQYLSKETSEEIISIYNDILTEISDLIVLQEFPFEISLENIEFNINSLSRILPNDAYVNKIYQQYLPTSESFFKNALQLKTHIRYPINISNTDEFFLLLTNFEVQASFGEFLELHFGILLPPFFIPGHSSFINRVLLTPILAHEFGHHIFNEIRWALYTNENLLEKRKCLSDQFSRFRFENLNEFLNGTRYEFENLPDNIGTTIIDKFIDKYTSVQGVVLPGLPYSALQLAYMSASQTWCSKSNLEKDIHHKNFNNHAPQEFRLMGMMQNSKGYPIAFNCSEGSFMNPVTKCSLLDTNRS